MKRAALLGLCVASLCAACGGVEEAPAAAASCDTGETIGAVVTALHFTREASKGVAPGFDVDARLSDGDDTVTCGHADRTDPDGVPGIDNELSGLVPDIEEIVGDAVDGLIQGAINNGELLILLEVKGVDGLVDDGCVEVATEIGDGTPAIGNDGVIESYQTYDLDASNVRSESPPGRIEGGVLRVGPFDMAIPIAIFDVSFTLNVHSGRVRLEIDEDTGKMKGLLGGGIVVEELLDGVKVGAGVSDFIGPIAVVARAASDLAPDEEGKCRQLSVAMEVEAVPAFVRRDPAM
jgi:hypothetical protein